MLFSIVIPVYNVAAYLEACVDSVLGNNCMDCEIILVDDGSTDGICPQLCDRLGEKHSPMIRVIHQANKGLGGARNTGLEAAKGKYLFFLDSDDTIVPDTLDMLREAILKYHSPQIITFNTALVPEGGGMTTYQHHGIPVGQVCNLRSYPAMLLDPPMSCARLWDRELFLKTGIRFPDRLLYEDLCTVGKLLLEAESVVGIAAAPYLYLQRTGSIMRSAQAERCGELMTVLDDVMGYFREKGQFEHYADEICTMAIAHVSYACYRVVLIDPDHRLLKEFPAYLESHFPGYGSSPFYKKALSRTQQFTFGLIRHGYPRLCNRLFKLKSKLH